MNRRTLILICSCRGRNRFRRRSVVRYQARTNS